MRICKLINIKNGYKSFLELYYKRNRKNVLLCFHTVIETLVVVWENSK